MDSLQISCQHRACKKHPQNRRAKYLSRAPGHGLSPPELLLPTLNVVAGFSCRVNQHKIMSATARFFAAPACRQGGVACPPPPPSPNPPPPPPPFFSPPPPLPPAPP